MQLLDGVVTAGGDDVGGTPLAGQRVPGLGRAAEHDDPLGAEHPGGQDAGQADRAVTDDRDRVSGLDPGADGGVVAGGHHVGQGEQRGHRLVGEVRALDLDQGAVGLRDADELGLAAVTLATLAEEAAVDAGGVEAGLAVRAGAVAPGERRDDEVADREVLDVVADLVDHADELVPDRAVGQVGDAAVEPEVRSADAGQDDAHDRVGRLGDGRLRPLLDGDVALAVEDRCLHRVVSLDYRWCR